MKRFPSILAFLCITLTSVSVLANPSPQWSDGGAALDAILDDFSINPDNTSVDVTNDYLVNDSYWSINASGGSIHAIVVSFIGSVSGKSFGVFAPDSDNDGNLEMIQLFNGSASEGDMVTIGIKSDGSVHINNSDTGTDFIENYFGYYMVSGDNIWYSDSYLNNDSLDHMVAYQGNGTDIVQIPDYSSGVWTTNSYLFAFEESSVPGDYADFVFTAESISPEAIPAPGALVLVMIGIGSLKLKSRKIA